MSGWDDRPDLHAGEYPTGAQLEAILDQIAALTAAGWTPYTPTWTGSSSNPAIGDGAIVGAYRQVPGSDLIITTGRILIGSTTTPGSGRWIVSLPVNAAAATVGSGSATVYDASVSTGGRPATCWFNSAADLRFMSTGGDLGAASPLTWATGDQIRWTMLYEAA